MIRRQQSAMAGRWIHSPAALAAGASNKARPSAVAKAAHDFVDKKRQCDAKSSRSCKGRRLRPGSQPTTLASVLYSKSSLSPWLSVQQPPKDANYLLAGHSLGAPGKVAVVQAEGAELAAPATNADGPHSDVGGQLGVSGLATHFIPAGAHGRQRRWVRPCSWTNN